MEAIHQILLDIFLHSRMLLNQSADWSRGEINVMPGLIEFFWTPDIIIHDLVRWAECPESPVNLTISASQSQKCLMKWQPWKLFRIIPCIIK